MEDVSLSDRRRAQAGRLKAFQLKRWRHDLVCASEHGDYHELVFDETMFPEGAD